MLIGGDRHYIHDLSERATRKSACRVAPPSAAVTALTDTVGPGAEPAPRCRGGGAASWGSVTVGRVHVGTRLIPGRWHRIAQY
jgi:hypothetical protein